MIKLARRLKRELKDLENCPLMSVTPDENNIQKLTAIIEGPSETPYEGGKFRLEITLPKDYPFREPEVKMMTKIFHPNIDAPHICLDVLKERWSFVMTIRILLLSILSLLDDPNPASPLNIDAAKLWKLDREKYNETVRLWVKEYASSE